MKVSKPFILPVPTLFVEDLKVYLKEYPPNFNYTDVYFYYIIYSIAYRMLTAKENQTFVKINMQKLKSITVSNIGKYIKILENGEFLDVDNNYIKGKNSRRYKINDKYLDHNSVAEIEIKPRTNLFKKINKKNHNKKAHYNKLPDYLRLMQKELMNLEFDYKGAFQFIKKNKNENYKIALIHYTAIQNINDKRMRYFFRSKSNGRLNTNLTNLWKDLRQFLKGNYVNIDLKNSQPFFLTILINAINNNTLHHTGIMYEMLINKVFETFGIIALKRISKIHTKAKKRNRVSLSLMLKNTQKGTFYEYLQGIIKDKSRDEIKKITFEIYYSKNKDFQKNKNFFRQAFPYILEVTEILKEKNYKLLSIFMQQIESYIFIDCIAKELVNAGIIPLTIHDSVIIKRENQQKTLEIMKHVFKEQIGIVPTFHIEPLKPQKMENKELPAETNAPTNIDINLSQSPTIKLLNNVKYELVYTTRLTHEENLKIFFKKAA